MDAIVKIEHLNFWYERGKPAEMLALKDINLEIKQGEYVAFFGPSGSGKSTLLYLISGVEMAQEGKVIINDKNLAGLSKNELASYRQTGVGMIFQQFNLIPSLTVVDNVALPMSFLGIDKASRRATAMKLLKDLGLDHLADRLPYELSGGQQQRVGIARALANDAPVIIADEPIGNLDSTNANNVMEFLKQLNEKEGKTIIIVTHEAWSLRDASKVFYVKDGKIDGVEEMRNKNRAETIAKKLYESLSLSAQGEAKTKGQKNEPYPVSGILSLNQLFASGYSTEEIEKFKSLLSQRFAGAISGETLKAELGKPFKQGGGGLRKKRAYKVSLFIESLIALRQELSQALKELEADPERSLSVEIFKVRQWLLEDYRGMVSGEQVDRLDELVGDVLRNIIDLETFKKTLNLTKNKLGVGLFLRSSETLYEKLKMVMERPD